MRTRRRDDGWPRRRRYGPDEPRSSRERCRRAVRRQRLQRIPDGGQLVRTEPVDEVLAYAAQVGRISLLDALDAGWRHHRVDDARIALAALALDEPLTDQLVHDPCQTAGGEDGHR